MCRSNPGEQEAHVLYIVAMIFYNAVYLTLFEVLNHAKVEKWRSKCEEKSTPGYIEESTALSSHDDNTPN